MNKDDLRLALWRVNQYYNDLGFKVAVSNNEIGFIVYIQDEHTSAEIRAYDVGNKEGLAIFITGMLEVIKVANQCYE